MTITAPVYCTREEVKQALDSKVTARDDAKVDRALESASRAIEGQLHRRFYPEIRTIRTDWPNGQYAPPWRLWLDSNEAISVSSLSSGGVAIASTDYFLRRADDLDEPPYNVLELDLGSSAAFGGGASPQRDITLTGLFGYRNDETAAGDAASSISSSATSLDVTDSAAVGVGSLLRIGTERLIVTGKTMKTTAQTLQTPLGAAKNEETVAVTNGAAYALGETILLDAERMLIVDIAGNSLIVKRGWDGSTLAAHTGSTIYAPRTLTVRRGVLGTTAAAITSGDDVLRWDPPASIRSLCLAEALNEVLQTSSGYARTTGSGDRVRELTGHGLDDLRDRAYTSHGRKARIRAV